jgi:hypothetical protein
MSADSIEDRQVFSVVPRGAGWDVQEEGRAELIAAELDRDEAIAVARSLAEASPFGQILVHRADGTIEYESTCAKRARPPRRGTASI